MICREDEYFMQYPVHKNQPAHDTLFPISTSSLVREMGKDLSEAGTKSHYHGMTKKYVELPLGKCLVIEVF